MSLADRPPVAAGPPVRPSLRLRSAIFASRAVGAASRALRLGRGSVISGDIAVRIAPDALGQLARLRRVVFVTGTNGKTTTTWMTTEAVRTRGPVASNREGSNMATGLVGSLAAAPTSATAVLEVDEIFLAELAAQARPAAIALLNLSREFTRGVSLGRTLDAWRRFVARIDWPCTLVANADDPLVVWAVAARSPATRVVWVGAGLRWTFDARRCPACGEAIDFADHDWVCRSGDLSRPASDWTVTGGRLTGPGVAEAVHAGAPGGWLPANVAFAVALAQEVGVPAADALRAAAAVADVDGRYRLIQRGSHGVRISMVKNPASWHEALTLAHQPGHLVLAMDRFGIKDTTSLWDVPIDPVSLGRVTASGERYADLAARLEAAGADFTVEPDPVAAIDAAPAGPVHVIANYTAMINLKKRLIR